ANGQRPPQDSFDQEEEQMSAIENRDRQQVQYGEIDADHRHEVQQVFEALLGVLAGSLNDQDRPANLVGRDTAADQLPDAESQSPNPPGGLAGAHPDGFEERNFLRHETALDADAERRPLHLVEDVPVFLRLRRHLQVETLAGAIDSERESLAIAAADEL